MADSKFPGPSEHCPCVAGAQIDTHAPEHVEAPFECGEQCIVKVPDPTNPVKK